MKKYHELAQKVGEIKSLLNYIQETTETSDLSEVFDLNEADEMYYTWKELLKQVQVLETEFGNVYAIIHNSSHTKEVE